MVNTFIEHSLIFKLILKFSRRGPLNSGFLCSVQPRSLGLGEPYEACPRLQMGERNSPALKGSKMSQGFVSAPDRRNSYAN